MMVGVQSLFAIQIILANGGMVQMDGKKKPLVNERLSLLGV